MAQFNAADIQEPPFPGSILHDNNPPTAHTILASVGPAAVWNLYRVLHDNIHYEHGTYGYWNAVLHAILPTDRGYQIEAQYPLRRSVGHQYGSSQSSIGGEYRSRNVTGHETDIQYPDFMITKCFPMPLGSPRRKHVLTIIEIKVNSNDVEAFNTPARGTVAGAQTQLERYVTRIAKTQGISSENPFVAYLVYGRLYKRVTVSAAQPLQAVWDDAEWIFVRASAGRDPFLNILSEISATHWNMVS
ncbi:hypothetical protein B0H19DRAFT_1204461 [Mycena capillaripes]|nr:hypothetical protein B0H19DRAFT_1204461 [Mycena capillaripes]